MKKFNITRILSSLLAFTMIAGIGLSFLTANTQTIATEATSATTYTRTTNSDGNVIRSQDGYIPDTTYDRIGLDTPQDMVIDTVVEDGKTVEYGYILNKATKPYLTKFNLADVNGTFETIDLSPLPYITSPTGLWLQTTKVNGVTRKELYIADGTARMLKYQSGSEKLYYSGLIYRVQFDLQTNLLMLNQYDIIHEPTKACPVDEPDCLPQRTPSFGVNTVFNPKKVAVDTSGNIFIASEGTSSGMIQLSYSGDFVSFFVVNTVDYNFIYQFVKKYGTSAQLDKLKVDTPASFFNVFIDNNDLVYSVSKSITTVFNKYSTSGSSILENAIKFPNVLTTDLSCTDSFVTSDGLIYVCLENGMIYVFAPDGSLIFFFGTTQSSSSSSVTPDIVGFFKSLQAMTVDKSNRIWAIDQTNNFVQTFTPTLYSSAIFDAIVSFNNHDYEGSRQAWEDVLRYDSLSVLANDGLGKAYYYDLDFDSSLQYFSTSKNRGLYSNVFWELRNNFLQDNLSFIIIIAIGIILFILLLRYLFNNVKKLVEWKGKVKKVGQKRWFKDLTVGFRLIKKPGDTYYELKVKRRGSIWGATLYYILAIAAFTLNTYCYALPFQTITINTLSVSTVIIGAIAVLFVFVLCNYLVSAINDGEGTFIQIYKFTGYSLLPMILLLPLSVGISYGLTLNEQVIITFLKAIAFWGSGILLVIGIIETHNYTFSQTVKNILLTIVFMLLFAVICMVIYVMFDQIATLLEQIWKEVKLRVGWY